MEKKSPRIEKKSIEPKFILNRFNGLFKSNGEVVQLLQQGKEEIDAYEMQDIRKEQLRLYNEFVKSVLGYDIDSEQDKEKDPFYQVAGVGIDEVYYHKHDLVKPTKNDFLASPSTLLVSGELILNEKIKVEVFDPVFINTYYDWMVQFGFLSFPQNKNNFSSGIITLEPQVIDSIKQIPESLNIEKKLQEILTWFNHDLTAHGTLLPRNGFIDMKISQMADPQLGEVFNNDEISESSDQFNSAFAGELWSLNLHQSIFQKFVLERPAIMRYLRMHLDNYIRSVEQAVSEIQDEKLALGVKDYLLKVYGFGFFRLINPVDFKTSELFKDIATRYPTISDLGTKEDHARSFVFGEEGLLQKNKEEEKFIPHKTVFSRFVNALHKTSDIEKRIIPIEKKLSDLKRNPEALSEEEKKLFKEHLMGIDQMSMIKIIQKQIEGPENFEEFDKVDIYNISRKHKEKLIDVFLEGNFGTEDDFIEKVYKRIYGFYYKQMMQNHLEQMSRRV